MLELPWVGELVSTIYGYGPSSRLRTGRKFWKKDALFGGCGEKTVALPNFGSGCVSISFEFHLKAKASFVPEEDRAFWIQMMRRRRNRGVVVSPY